MSTSREEANKLVAIVITQLAGHMAGNPIDFYLLSSSVYSLSFLPAIGLHTDTSPATSKTSY